MGERACYHQTVTKEATELLASALQLGADERVQLAEELLASLNGQENNVQAAWAAEISRRAAEARNEDETAPFEDWRAVLQRIERETLKR